MKRIIQKLSMLLFILLTFFLADKLVNNNINNTYLMKEINSLKDEYKVLPVTAVIDDDTIIPGINGKEVEVFKTYQKMRKSNIFDEDDIVYKTIFSSVLLEDNKDKYIIKGNDNKNKVSILVIYNINDLSKIKKIDNNITIFINHKNITLDTINKLKDKKVYTYGDNGIYTKEILMSDNSIINNVSNNKSKYCLFRDKNDSMLKLCSNNKMYSIIPNIIGSYSNIKDNLTNGSIILLDNLNNINQIIKYINSKGYEIVDIDTLLKE